MARIQWDKAGEKQYHAGVDRGVIYRPFGAGVPWNGLISVSENKNGVMATGRYQDGIKGGIQTSIGDYSATITAYTYPNVLDEALGNDEYYDGLTVTEQPISAFGLIYRNKIGNDTEGIDLGYKIHILYGVVAIPSEVTYNTLSEMPSVSNFSWTIQTTPIRIPDGRMTGHVVIDSTTTPSAVLRELEDYIYGSSSTYPQLPSYQKLLDIWGGFSELIITEYGDGTYSAEGPTVKSLGSDRFSISHRNVLLMSDVEFSVESS